MTTTVAETTPQVTTINQQHRAIRPLPVFSDLDGESRKVRMRESVGHHSQDGIHRQRLVGRHVSRPGDGRSSFVQRRRVHDRLSKRPVIVAYHLQDPVGT